jgi:hypothetical protein
VSHPCKSSDPEDEQDRDDDTDALQDTFHFLANVKINRRLCNSRKI